MQNINARDNLLRTLHRQGFDWVPVDQNNFCPSQVEAFKKRFGHTRIVEHFENPMRFCELTYAKTFSDPKALYPRTQLPANISFDEFGVGSSFHDGCYHLTRMHHPLEGDATLEEIKKYPFPILNDDISEVSRFVQGIQAQGLAVMGGMMCSVWEQAWYLRSMEDMMVDLLTEDERAIALLDRTRDFACERARFYAQAGVDILHVADDIGMQAAPMMAPDLWRKWIKPRCAEIILVACDAKPDILIRYHSCGYSLPFIEDLIEIGVDILNPIQPECMDLAELHRRYGDRLSFWSTIGTQHILPFGTPEDVRAAVRRDLDICGEQGGIVISPTHMVEPEVPWENLEAMRLAAKEYRK